MARDIVLAFVEALELEGVAPDLAARVADRLRSEYGGDRCYVPKLPAQKKTLAVAAGFQSGLSIRQIVETMGLPERTARWHASRRLRRP